MAQYFDVVLFVDGRETEKFLCHNLMEAMAFCVRWSIEFEKFTVKIFWLLVESEEETGRTLIGEFNYDFPSDIDVLVGDVYDD